jgi:hypothetical protein
LNGDANRNNYQVYLLSKARQNVRENNRWIVQEWVLTLMDQWNLVWTDTPPSVSYINNNLFNVSFFWAEKTFNKQKDFEDYSAGLKVWRDPTDGMIIKSVTNTGSTSIYIKYNMVPVNTYTPPPPPPPTQPPS